MIKLFSILLLAAAPLLVKSQSVSSSVISSTGNFTSNANISVSSTAGEMSMVQTFSSSSVILTQGFQQPDPQPVSIDNIIITQPGSLSIYPNPATDNVWLGFELNEAGQVAIAIYDVLGQKISDVYNGTYNEGKVTQQVSLNGLAAGSYYLGLSFTAEKSKKTQTVTKSFYVIN